MYRINDFEKKRKIIVTINKFINFTLYLIIVPIIIYNVTLIIQNFINPNKTANFLGYKSFIIVSGSMEPTIMTGDAIMVKEVPESEIKVNDIITFQDGSVITTHRIVEVTEENGKKKYTTKGDNNEIADKEKVVFEKIEGKYQFKINAFGRIVNILQSKVTLILLVAFIIINYMHGCKLYDKKQIRKEKRMKYKENKEM